MKVWGLNGLNLDFINPGISLILVLLKDLGCCSAILKQHLFYLFYFHFLAGTFAGIPTILEPIWGLDGLNLDCINLGISSILVFLKDLCCCSAILKQQLELLQ